MTFFKTVDFSEVLHLFGDASDDVITQPFFNWQGGPSFIVNGVFDAFEPREIPKIIADKVLDYKDDLDSMNAYIYDTIQLLPSVINSVKVEKKTSVLSLYCSYYPHEVMSIEDMIAAPFHADGSNSGLLKEIDVANWNPWRLFSWINCYDPAHDKDTHHYNLDRKDRFRVEDTHLYIKKYGNVSFQKSGNGDVVIDAEEDKWEESRLSGGRDGYYENHEWFKRTHEIIPDLPEMLRKEIHLVYPSFRIEYNVGAAGSRKSSILYFQVFKFDADRLIVLMESCSRLKNPAEIKITEEKQESASTDDSSKSKAIKNQKKKSFFGKLFGK